MEESPLPPKLSSSHPKPTVGDHVFGRYKITERNAGKMIASFFLPRPLSSPGFKREEVLEVTNHETLCDGSGKQISGGDRVKKSYTLHDGTTFYILLTQNQLFGIHFYII